MVGLSFRLQDCLTWFSSRNVKSIYRFQGNSTETERTCAVGHAIDYPIILYPEGDFYYIFQYASKQTLIGITACISYPYLPNRDSYTSSNLE